MRDMKDPNNNSNSKANMTFSNEIILTNQFNMEDNPVNPVINPNPFAEYMWMENEEEFNRQVEEELWEEDFIERCFQEMLEEEELLEWFIPSRDLLLASRELPSTSTSSAQAVSALQEQISLMVLDQDMLVVNSNLNPNAEEFTPAIQKTHGVTMRRRRMKMT